MKFNCDSVHKLWQTQSNVPSKVTRTICKWYYMAPTLLSASKPNARFRSSSKLNFRDVIIWPVSLPASKLCCSMRVAYCHVCQAGIRHDRRIRSVQTMKKGDSRGACWCGAATLSRSSLLRENLVVVFHDVMLCNKPTLFAAGEGCTTG